MNKQKLRQHKKHEGQYKQQFSRTLHNKRTRLRKLIRTAKTDGEKASYEHGMANLKTSLS